MATRTFDLVFADIVLAADMIDEDPLSPIDFAIFHGAATPTLDLAFAVVDLLAHIDNAADSYIDLPRTWRDEDGAYHTRYPYPAAEVFDRDTVPANAAPTPPLPPSDYQLAHLAEMALLLLDPNRPWDDTLVESAAVELADVARALCDLWHSPQLADACISTIHAYGALFSVFGPPLRDDGLPGTAEIDPFVLMDDATRDRIRRSFAIGLMQYDPTSSPSPSVVCRAGYRATVHHRTARTTITRDGDVPHSGDPAYRFHDTRYDTVAAALAAVYVCFDRVSREAEGLQAEHDFARNP